MGATMTRIRMQSLAVLGLVLSLQSHPLTAQSAAAANHGDSRRLLSFRNPLNLANFRALAVQRPEPYYPDAVAMKLAKVKTFDFRTVDYPGAFGSAIFDLNKRTPVGLFDLTDQNTAFYFQGNSYHPLNVPDSVASFASGISAAGQIVGSFDNSAGARQGFLYDGTTFTVINPAGSAYSDASGISDSGVIVGDYEDSSNHLHGYVDDGGNITTIDYPASLATAAFGINSKGDIVGLYVDSNNSVRGFLLSNGTYYSIDFPLAAVTRALGINDAGTIVGEFRYPDKIDHGFIYSRGAFSQVDVTGAAATQLFRIKNNGNIVGTVTDKLGEGHGIIGH